MRDRAGRRIAARIGLHVAALHHGNTLLRQDLDHRGQLVAVDLTAAMLSGVLQPIADVS